MSDAEEKLWNEFLTIKPDLERWGKHVDKKIMKLLASFNSDYRIKIPPRFRLKDKWKFISKALYRKKPYENPIVDVEDKIGTRVVFLKSSDVYEALDILLEYKGWNCKVTKDLRNENKPSEFDYQSAHLVVSPINQKGFQSDPDQLTCEIQLRTLLQHAYAEMSHDSTYKGPFKNDIDIVRRLAKSMALMEATDDYFVQVFEMISDTKRKYLNFNNELIKMYQTIKPSFSPSHIDIQLAETMLDLLQQKEVLTNELEMFLEKEKSKIEPAINSKKTYLSGQPIILLIAYYFFKNRTFLRKNWPLSESSLKQIYNSFGHSYD